jgi:osmotically-inducible protein OsmY
MKTDAQLKTDVLEELKWEPSVNAAHIGVEVREGVVTLAGHVDNYAEKWHAERATQRVAGVRALAVEIDVNLPGISQRPDADIASSAARVLDWMGNLPKGSVKVAVEDGWVTLSGTVDWDYQRRSATQAVRYLLGVTGVSDQVTLKSHPVSQAAVKSAILAALHRRANTEASTIAVDVNGAEVTLTGTADSWAERELVKHSAWNTLGVHSVVDRIVVAY